MSDIDFGQLSEALNDKSDRDLRNVDTTAKADAVIDFQLPTAENGYTWYRKYKSGWVEQGGEAIITSNGNNITLPIEMANTNYVIFSIVMQNTQAYNRCFYRTTTVISMASSGGNNTSSWEVKGLAAN